MTVYRHRSREVPKELPNVSTPSWRSSHILKTLCIGWKWDYPHYLWLHDHNDNDNRNELIHNYVSFSFYKNEVIPFGDFKWSENRVKTPTFPSRKHVKINRYSPLCKWPLTLLLGGLKNSDHSLFLREYISVDISWNLTRLSCPLPIFTIQYVISFLIYPVQKNRIDFCGYLRFNRECFLVTLNIVTMTITTIITWTFPTEYRRINRLHTLTSYVTLLQSTPEWPGYYFRIFRSIYTNICACIHWSIKLPCPTQSNFVATIANSNHIRKTQPSHEVFYSSV